MSHKTITISRIHNAQDRVSLAQIAVDGTAIAAELIYPETSPLNAHSTAMLTGHFLALKSWIDSEDHDAS